MRTTLNVSAIALVFSSFFICGTPVLAAGTGTDSGSTPTVSPTSGNYGKTVGTDEVKKIQQMLNDTEAQTIDKPATNDSGNSGTASDKSAALYQPPDPSNPGTLAESAKTTALSTSTYSQ